MLAQFMPSPAAVSRSNQGLHSCRAGALQAPGCWEHCKGLIAGVPAWKHHSPTPTCLVWHLWPLPTPHGASAITRPSPLLQKGGIPGGFPDAVPHAIPCCEASAHSLYRTPSLRQVMAFAPLPRSWPCVPCMTCPAALAPHPPSNGRQFPLRPQCLGAPAASAHLVWTPRRRGQVTRASREVTPINCGPVPHT